MHRAEEHARARAERSPELAGDKFAARTARQHMLERLKEPIELDSLCFGRIDIENGRTHYLGRRALLDEDGKLIVINWRMPVAAPFYTASRQDPQGRVLFVGKDGPPSFQFLQAPARVELVGLGNGLAPIALGRVEKDEEVQPSQ